MEPSQLRRDAEFNIRPGTSDDLVAAHKLFLHSITDLMWRMGIQDYGQTPSEQEREDDLRHWRPLLEYLTASADQYWVAECKGESDGELIGFSRSILRDGVRELTEFFVAPNRQSGGVGRELLARALPPGARRTYIMASSDLRAQALYHKMGFYQLCAVYTFHVRLDTLTAPLETRDRDLTFIPMALEDISIVANLDKITHGHRRDSDHVWFLSDRTGFLVMRHQNVVGYGYVGAPFSGPFVLLDDSDFPAVLARAEWMARDAGYRDFGLDIPMLNRIAIQYLLNRGFQMSPFFCYYMCDQSPLNIHKTIITAPMIMI